MTVTWPTHEEKRAKAREQLEEAVKDEKWVMDDSHNLIPPEEALARFDDDQLNLPMFIGGYALYDPYQELGKREAEAVKLQHDADEFRRRVLQWRRER